MANPNDFLLNTDYEMDKITYFSSGSFTGTTSFPHNQKYAPLVFGVWSTTEDFSNSSPLGPVVTASDPNASTPLGIELLSKSDNIQLTSYGDGKDNTKIYYRVYGFEPYGVYESAPHTSKDAKKFILNTDYNYRKLKASGEFTQSGQEYAHNLGYLPHVMAWVKFKPGVVDGAIMPLNSASEFTEIYMNVTTDKIKVSFSTVLIEKVYWRIYHDET